MSSICAWIMNCVNCGHCVCSHRAKKLVASAAKCQCPDRKDERPCQLGSGAAGRKDAGEWGTWEKRMCFSGYNAADTHNFTAGAYRRQNLNHCVASSAFCYNLRFMGDILQFTLSQKHFATVSVCDSKRNGQYKLPSYVQPASVTLSCIAPK